MMFVVRDVVQCEKWFVYERTLSISQGSFVS